MENFQKHLVSVKTVPKELKIKHFKEHSLQCNFLETLCLSKTFPETL